MSHELFNVSVEMYEGYMNMPKFIFDVPAIPEEDIRANAEFVNYRAGGHKLMHSAYHNRCYYQSLCPDRSGNTHYAFDDYPSGWSSRVSVINRAFGRQYVEASGPQGIQVTAALYAIRAQYNGALFVWREDTVEQVEYNLMPWDFTLGKRWPISRHVDSGFLLVETGNPVFIALCLKALDIW